MNKEKGEETQPGSHRNYGPSEHNFSKDSVKLDKIIWKLHIGISIGNFAYLHFIKYIDVI